MNYYFYVCNAGRGNFLAATCNEARAIHAIALALVATYPDFHTVKVYKGHPAQSRFAPTEEYKIQG